MSIEMLENRESENKYSGILFSFYAIVTLAIYILPYTKLMFPYILVALLMLASFPLIVFKKNSWGMYGLLLCIATFFLAFAFLSSGVVNGINEIVRNLRMFLPILWGVYAINYCGRETRKIILLGFVAVTLIVLFSTIKALQENPWIARLLAQDQSHSSDEINKYRLQNVGGYPFAYMVGALTICIAWLALELKKIWQKIVAIAALVLCYFYIIQTMYTTLLILTTVCVFIMLMFFFKSVILKSLLIIVAMVVAFGLGPLFNFLSKALDSPVLSVKFHQLYLAVSGGGIDSLGSRPTLIKEALENWIKTPIFGGNYDTPAHSVLFEALQSQGLFGLFIWIFLYAYTWYFMLRELKKNRIDTLMFNMCMVYFSILSVLNDTRHTFEITIAVFFIIPVVASLQRHAPQNVCEED